MDNLEVDVLRRLAVELLRRQPAVFADLVNGEMAVHGQPQPDPGASPPTADDTPDWCNCGLCRVMPTQEENKCCCRTMHVKNSSFSATCFGWQCSGFSYEVSGRCPCDGASSEQ